jgi:hypothetical protein
MHIREIDRRVGPLHDVIVGIDAGLAAIHERLNSEEGFDGTSAREHVEPLLGLAFVAAQSYALGSVSDLNAVATSRGRGKREKLACYACDPMPPVKGVVTRMQLINASANYFKHHDEWERWPTGRDRGVHDTTILGGVGITEMTEFPCIAAIDLLCGTSWETIVLHQTAKEWRAHLFTRLL